MFLQQTKSNIYYIILIKLKPELYYFQQLLCVFLNVFMINLLSKTQSSTISDPLFEIDVQSHIDSADAYTVVSAYIHLAFFNVRVRLTVKIMWTKAAALWYSAVL